MLTIRHSLTVAVDPYRRTARAGIRGQAGPDPLAVSSRPRPIGTAGTSWTSA